MEKNKKRKLGLIIWSIVLFAVAAVIIYITYFLPNLGGLDEVNENNTTQYEGTVERVEKLKDGVSIKLVEYDCKLTIEADFLMDGDDLMSLQEGEKITFRVRWVDVNPFTTPDISEIAICSLNTSEEEIIPLSRANDVYLKHLRITRIVATIIVICIVGCAVYICVSAFVKTKKESEVNK